MLALRTSLISCVLMALIVGVCVDAHKRAPEKRQVNIVQAGTPEGDAWICQYFQTIASWLGVNCNNPATNPPTTPGPTTPGPTTPGLTTPGSTPADANNQQGVSSTAATTGSSTTASSTTSTSTPTPLERITWCRLSNGSYLAYGQTYMSTLCTICQCTATRFIQCNPFQCMPTYCMDNSTPTTRSGQCCPQCSTDPAPISCTYTSTNINAVFPTGVILRSDSTMKCWCQLGNIECRNGAGQLFDSLDLWGDGTAVYIILAVLGSVLIFGTLLCCGCTIFFYYYYQRNQGAFQQVYDQYYNNSAGWQPMADQDGLVEVSAEDKQADAEQGQFESEQYLSETEKDSSARSLSMPPPYALYNGAYVSEEQHNLQKKL